MGQKEVHPGNSVLFGTAVWQNANTRTAACASLSKLYSRIGGLEDSLY